MNDSESELPGVNIEAIFPHHIARVRSEMDKDRAEEYVRKGNKLLNGLIWTFVTAVLLFSHTLADLFSFMQDLETQILIGIFTIYAIVHFEKFPPPYTLNWPRRYSVSVFCLFV